MTLIDIEAGYEGLYDFAMAKHYIKHIDAAKLKFVFKEHQEDIQGFNEWFIFNFTNEEMKEPLVKAYEKLHKNEVVTSIAKSLRSVFEVTQNENGFIIQDIFTKDSYMAHPDQIIDTGLVSLRLIVEDSNAIVIGDMIRYDPLYKDVIIKYILDQYNQVAGTSGPKSIQSFLSDNTILLFKITTIMSEIYEDAVEEEDFLLYQETYVIKISTDQLFEALNNLESTLKFQKDEEDDFIWNIIMDDRQMGEVEVNAEMVAFLFNNPNDKESVLEYIMTLEGDSFIKFKSEVLTIDELL